MSDKFMVALEPNQGHAHALLEGVRGKATLFLQIKLQHDRHSKRLYICTAVFLVFKIYLSML